MIRLCGLTWAMGGAVVYGRPEWPSYSYLIFEEERT